MPTITVAAGSGYLINGAGQKHIPVSTDANGNNVDNRYQALSVDTGTGAPKIGDAFTIAGVNAVSLIHKNETTELQTFRIVGGLGGVGTTPSTSAWTITPPIIVGDPANTQAEKEYANASAAPADAAVITFLNTATAPANIFFLNGAVEIVHGSLATMDLDGAGVATMRQSTDSGIEILFAKGSEIENLGTQYRLTMWVSPNVLIPDMCGVMLGSQI